MYYILNETGQIVAADDQLLHLCGVSHIDALVSQIIKSNTTFDFMSENTVSVTTGEDKETFTVTKTSLSSMLGNLTLVGLSTEDESESATPLLDNLNIAPSIEDEITDDEDSESDFLDNLDLHDTDDDTQESDISIEDHHTDDIMNLIDEPISIQSEEDEPSQKVPDDAELFDLIDNDEKEAEDNTPLEAISLDISKDEPLDLGFDNIDLVIDTPEVADEPEIAVDVESISRKIGISTDDYNNFLNEFIDTALELEKDLQSSKLEVRSEAIGTLSHLSDILYLPDIGTILDTITNASDGEQREVIESFYRTLSRITTSAPTADETETVNKSEEEKLELFDEPETIREPKIQEEVAPRNATRKSTSEDSFGTISLEGIKPKHFDFQLEEAANDLSLPVELIEEFVHDFIDQAHIETKKMLEAYENGDFDTIKKIGHLLKGASSNLRINALSDTLYKIQFCEDSSTLEPLIKDYWAHFLSFENQINVISN